MRRINKTSILNNSLIQSKIHKFINKLNNIAVKVGICLATKKNNINKNKKA